MSAERRPPSEARDFQQVSDRIAALERRLVPEDRRAFVFSNGWRAYLGGLGGAGVHGTNIGYFKTAAGIVHLEGVLDKNGGNFVGAETMITLPTGYRPPSARAFVAAASGGAAAFSVRIDVAATGIVSFVVGHAGGANPVVFVSLDGMSFRAD